MNKICEHILNGLAQQGKIRRGGFKFPAPIPLTKRLKDVLEPEVDEKYYLDDEKAKALKFPDISKSVVTSNIVKVGDLDIKGQEQIRRVYSVKGVSPTLSTMQGGNRQPKRIDDTYGFENAARVYSNVAPTLRSGRQGLKVAEPYVVASRGRDPENPSDRTAGNPNLVQRLEPRKDGLSNTITTVQKDNYVATPFRIRKLTPLSCYRLMGFDDEDFRKAGKVCSNTQLYKQAGNSIVVNVLEAILTNLL